jgi:hypothetical protein
MGFGDWIRRIFSANDAEEEAAEREEYGLPDRVDRETQRGRLGSFAGAEAAEAADQELDDLKAPRDPAP